VFLHRWLNDTLDYKQQVIAYYRPGHILALVMPTTLLLIIISTR